MPEPNAPGSNARGRDDTPPEREAAAYGGEGEPVDVLRIADIGLPALDALFAPAGLAVALVPPGTPIPGSHWGEEEAGLIGHTLHLREDTPVHSAVHEGCHWLLMDEARRARVHTDAGGTALEENAVCCLQILLADRIAGMDRARMLADMDRWGYSFRLGSAARWFAEDAEDARSLLRARAARLAPLMREEDPDDFRTGAESP